MNSGKTGAKYISTTSTNKFGMGQFSNAAYDYYRVSFDGDSTYLPQSDDITLQIETVNDLTMFLHKKSSTTAIIEHKVNNGSVD